MAPNAKTKTPVVVHPTTFAQAQLALLESEQEAEVTENSLLLSDSPPSTLARAGLAILNLVPASQRTGLGGKIVLELGSDPAVGRSELPGHGIRTGDIVRVAEQLGGGAKKREKAEAQGKGLEGVVTRVGERAVWVALGKGSSGREEDDVEVPTGKLWLVKLANDVTYKRMNYAMTKLSKLSDSEYTPLMQVLFGLSSPAIPDMSSVDDIQFVDLTLNDSQKHAVKFALASPEVALCWGPPGTGKTHTLIELILQMLKRSFRVLVCGPSNISVDNIVERLAPHKVSIVRLGHPARLLPSVLDHSLEVLTRTSDAATIVQDVRKEMDDKQASIRKTRNGRERRAIYGDLKGLRKEYRERENKCVDNMIRGSQVILATLHGAGGHQLHRQRFDAVIIDEASQALEAQCWVPLLGATKVVLAGDHLQLPPTVKSLNSKTQHKAQSELTRLGEELNRRSVNTEEQEAARSMKLEQTMFDRLLGLHGSAIRTMLTTQYRMHNKIMQFPSEELYESKLVAADAVRARLLRDLTCDILDTDDTREALVFFDTQGGDFPEQTEDDSTSRKSAILGDSKSNEMEATVVQMHVDSLIDGGVRAEDIAVVTPYNAQVAKLSSRLKERHPRIELGSIDGFQGREKEAVVVSLVRSNGKGEIGFLGEKRRLNVAMTRPKRHLCVVGDSETVSRGSSYLKKWMGFLEEHADLRYPDIANLQHR